MGRTLSKDPLWLYDPEGGAFQFEALQPGTYTLRIKDFYRDRVVYEPVELSSDQTLTIDLLRP